ncbi:MAG: hypothetical protein ABIT08_01840 [Bacteroidia bacterium]
MKFKEWKEWYKSLPDSLRWFVWLVLLRPIIDNFYYLKEVSPFLSPLNIVGVLTPIVIFFTLKKMKRPPQSNIDGNFRIYGGFVIAGIIVMSISGIALLPFWTVAIKITAIVYMFFFLRYFVRSKKDVDGLLQSFLYSSIVVICVFMFEMFVHPLNLVHSRGVERYQGSYADVFNYATYVTLCTLINYYFLLSTNTSLSRNARIRNVIINIVLGTAMLIKMSHVSTDVVFIALNILYFLIAFKKNAVGALIFASILALIVYSYGKDTIDEKLMPLIQTDVDVASGEGDEAYYLHGRVGRWERITEIFGNSSLLSQLFGMPFNGGLPFSFITGGIHNDYIRNLICVGYVGLTFYLILLFNLFRRIIKDRLNMLYLGLGALGSLLLFSVSTVPTIYPAFMYVILTVFAYFSIPENVLRRQEMEERSKLLAAESVESSKLVA